MKILITGGAGFIGSALAESLSKSSHELIILDSLNPQIHGANPKFINSSLLVNSNIRFVEGDIRDLGLVENLLQNVDSIVHLAAETGTGQSMYQISHYYSVNQQATSAIFESIALRHKNVRKIIIASSRSVYGEGAYLLKGDMIIPKSRALQNLEAGNFEPTGPNREPLSLIPTPESAIPSPSSFYAATKLANEQMGKIFSEAFAVDVTALRFQNVYGEGQSLNNPYTGILSIFSNRMRKNLPINIFEDGLESRDFIHVNDVVDSIHRALFSDLHGFNLFNIGSGIPVSVLEVAETLRRMLRSSSELKITGDFRVGDIRHCYADLRLAKSMLGFSPSINLIDGLGRFVNWVESQEIVNDKSYEAQSALAKLGLGRADGDQIETEGTPPS